VQQGVNGVHPPYLLPVLVRVREDRRRVQHLNVAHVSHEGKVFDVDAVVSQPHPHLVLESVGSMALEGAAALVQEPRHRCNQQKNMVPFLEKASQNAVQSFNV
jgi:hypothetical protein